MAIVKSELIITKYKLASMKYPCFLWKYVKIKVCEG